MSFQLGKHEFCRWTAARTDRNFDFRQFTQEETLIQVVRVRRAGRGRLCAHAPGPFLRMLSELGGSWGMAEQEMPVDARKIRLDPTVRAHRPRAEGASG